jgi:iron(II)-dependent oxidoreductase
VVGSDSGAANARPAHRLRLDAFGIERHEVTVGEYQRFMDSTRAPAPWNGTPGVASLPVTRVQWSEAANYCRWRHRDGGDLPSEEQWEATARGASGRAYPWGATFDAAAANIAIARLGAPAPVGTFPRGATPDGVDDLIGNVWEWTRSPMQSYPGAPAMADSLRNFYVIRGGAFNVPESVATPWYRGYNRPATSRDQLTTTGFRCVMPARIQSK